MTFTSEQPASAIATVSSPTVTPGLIEAHSAPEAPEPEAGPPTTRPRVGGPARLLRGRPEDPVWVRPALLGLLGATAVLYLWSLAESGWANAYYSAAAQAGTQSWKALFFGSFDAGNAITVDKAPLFLWPMALSARVFGVNPWSILVPQALEGVASVGLLYLAVRRWTGPVAGLIAGAVLAATPVAALMFRYNNPDALLVLLLTLGAYATMRAIDDGSSRWAMVAGACVGFGFLAKMLQALLVVPGFGLAYMVAAPGNLLRRAGRLALAGVGMLVAGGWWVAIVQAWPASSRPYIGGSQHNSVVELMFGYNGFGRLTGHERGSVGGGIGRSGRWGETGLLRLFNHSFGDQASWLLPTALLLLAALLVATWATPRTDRTRAATLLWGGWLVVTGLAISLGEGIIHEYYTVALAPAIGALVGIGAVTFWRLRDTVLARVTLASALGVTAWWAGTLLSRTPEWAPALRPAVLVGGALAAALLLLPPLGRVLASVAAVAGLVVALAAPAAYSWATAEVPHRGAIPTAGPGMGLFSGGGSVVTKPFAGSRARSAATPAGTGGSHSLGKARSGVTGQGGFSGPGLGSGGLGSTSQRSVGSTGSLGSTGRLGSSGSAGHGRLGANAGRGGQLPASQAGGPSGGMAGIPPGAHGGTSPTPMAPPGAGTGTPGVTRPGTVPGAGSGGFPQLGGGAVGGILEASRPSEELVALLEEDAASYRWVAATVSANQAAGYELATGRPVMALGGFNGTDPSPTLAQFKSDVAAGRIHWFIGRGMGFGGPGATTAQQINAWVGQHFMSTMVDGATIFDLTEPTSAS